MEQSKKYQFVGYNRLALIMEQERKHWLLKTTRKSQTYDNNGQLFEGTIDNLGSEIVVDSSKLDSLVRVLRRIKFQSEPVNQILEAAISQFTYAPTVNGLLFERIISVNYESISNRYNYKLKLEDCEVCKIPFGTDVNEAGVFASTWIRTKTKPKLILIDSIQADVSAVTLEFNDTVSDVTYYYPLDSFQSIGIQRQGETTTYITNPVNQNDQIGYPLFWYTCNETNIGPTIRFDENINSAGQQIFYAGGDGNSPKYVQHVYCALEDDATPDQSDIDEYQIECSPINGAFTNTGADFNIEIAPEIVFVKSGDVPIRYTVSISDVNSLTMSMNDNWEYVDDQTYAISMSVFSGNATGSSTLDPIFDVVLPDLPFTEITANTGHAGVQMSVSSPVSDTHSSFPYGLNTISGLPLWYGLTQELSDLRDSYDALQSDISELLEYAEQKAQGQTTTKTYDEICELITGVPNDESDPSVESIRNLLMRVTSSGSGLLNIIKGYRITFQNSCGAYKKFELDKLEACMQEFVYAYDEFYPMELYQFYDWDDIKAFLENYESFIGDMFDQNKRGTPQNLSMYAIHNTENSVPGRLDNSQYAALILDAGMEVNDDATELGAENIGRVYVLSNDDTSYVNNSIAENPKPGRTAARICDIPTSITQLTGSDSTSNFSVVDHKYVRTEAAFLESDQDKLYNVIGNRWVKPSDLNYSGSPVMQYDVNENNPFIFNTLNGLNSVDLVDHNEYRITKNLNRSIPANKVSIASIIQPGSGYAENDTGVIIVGGFGFKYLVTQVDAYGKVQEVSLSSQSEDDEINLSNFDFDNLHAGLTDVYGTSPSSGNGSGLTVTMILDDYSDYIPKKGSVYSDLYALIAETDGLYLYTYILDDPIVPGSDVISGTWTKSMKVADMDRSSNEGLSVKDAYMTAIIPKMMNLPVSYREDHQDPTVIQAMVNANSINVYDTTKSPVLYHDPSQEPTPGEIPCVDISKFYGRNQLTLTADTKSVDGVIQAIHAAGYARYDSYILWRWDNESDANIKTFKIVTLYRSLNNLVTTDESSFLPLNELKCDKYVNTNPGTSITWNVPGVGPMMWVYHPSYNIHEHYQLDSSTQELRITKTQFNWSDIDAPVTIVENGVLNWNILVNNPIQLGYNVSETDPIYQQPDFVQLDELTKGTNVSTIPGQYQPIGAWRLVFPRVEQFTFSNLLGGITYTPLQMQVIRSTDVSSTGDVVDSEGNIVNLKTMIVNSNENGSSVRVYNPSTRQWENV